MTSLFSTLLLTFAVMLIAFGLLAIGWLITGKAKICRGSCGRAPTLKKDKEKSCVSNQSCHLCETAEDRKNEL